MNLQICGLISQIRAQLQNCTCSEDASMPQGKNSSWKAEKNKNKQFRNFRSYPDAGEIEFEV